MYTPADKNTEFENWIIFKWLNNVKKNNYYFA